MLKEYNKTAIISGEREVSYSELLQRVAVFAHCTPVERGGRAVIFSENREGWIYAFYAIWAHRGIAVPVDAGSTVGDVAYILSDCRPACVWTSRLRLDVLRAAIEESGVTTEVRLIDDYEQSPVGTEKASVEYEDQDTALIIYTSGTTGSPKGVMLSFANLNANIYSVSKEVPIFNGHRRTLVLLPLHHVLPLVGTVVAPLSTGDGIALCPSMSGPDIMATLSRAQIGIMVGVPRLWQTLYNGIKRKIDAHFVTRVLFALCEKVDSISFSRRIFKAVHEKLGGHLNFCVCGGAALDVEVGRGLRTLGLEVLEGYGMTETAPMISFTRPGDIIPGCAGLPLSTVKMKLEDGELCVKGPNLMQGYYNRPEETAAVIDAEGFLHTGDLGRFDEQGRIYITGRSKEIIVLSNGKNVQPAELEYKLEKFEQQVKEAAVVQEGDLLCAVIVPQKDWADGMTDAEIEEQLKRQVLEPYNLTVAAYKKVMSVFVYHGDLPRTKLEKLQRYKIRDIVARGSHEAVRKDEGPEPTFREYVLIKRYIEAEKGVKVRPLNHVETDLAFDSLDKVGLQGFIEKTFGAKVGADTMAGFPHILAIAEHVAGHKTHIDEEAADTVDWAQTLREAPEEGVEIPSRSATLPMLSRLFRLFFGLYNRLEVRGKANLPAQGPYILAPNHQSYIDGPVVLAGLPSAIVPGCYSYATEEHVQSSQRRFFARRHNVVLMERSRLRDSILQLGEVLRRRNVLVIFPEGTRTRDGHLGDFKKTFAILASELRVPVVPVCIKGAYEALPRWRRWLKPHKVSVEYLEPLSIRDGEDYDTFAKRVREAVAGKLRKD